jgi:hypothetical protein
VIPIEWPIASIPLEWRSLLLYPTEIALGHIQKWLPKSNTAVEVAVGKISLFAPYWQPNFPN